MSNSIWKTGSPKGIHEEDRFGDYYVAEFHREDGSRFYEAGGTCDICGIPDRWIFLTDLIAQADKAERLQKAVNLAIQRLEQGKQKFGKSRMGPNKETAMLCEIVIDEIKQQIEHKEKVS